MIHRPHAVGAALFMSFPLHRQVMGWPIISQFCKAKWKELIGRRRARERSNEGRFPHKTYLALVACYITGPLFKYTAIRVGIYANGGCLFSASWISSSREAVIYLLKSRMHLAPPFGPHTLYIILSTAALASVGGTTNQSSKVMTGFYCGMKPFSDNQITLCF